VKNGSFTLSSAATRDNRLGVGGSDPAAGYVPAAVSRAILPPLLRCNPHQVGAGPDEPAIGTADQLLTGHSGHLHQEDWLVSYLQAGMLWDKKATNVHLVGAGHGGLAGADSGGALEGLHVA
jgi:hypothetical protein